ncbi:MAG: Rieske 2Fe-2S domain-containing protein [Mycobacterium sp.]|nr:Rieske 2Fe-2S domain-containing protein [Mycobacterium sp.]
MSVSEQTVNDDDLAKRVDDAVAALDDLDPAARAVAEELQASIEAIHKAGLVSIVRRLRADDATREALFELVDDPVVHLLLTLHGIVRPDPVTHANQVLESVRPQLHSHGGDVSLVRVEDGTAFVRLEGACNGCSMSSVTLRNLVEEALVQEVPAVTAVEGVADQPSPTLISVDSLFPGRDPGADGWVRVGPASDVAVDDISTATLNGTDVLIVNIGQRLSAYRNECAHEAMPLTDAVLDVSNGTLTCPWHGFCFDASSGECLSAPGAQLEQLPLRIDDGDVWVRVQ